ncbi:MAG: phosphoribosylamine--glycine ligase [Candidatus Pelagibacter sp. TMED166]|nr:MAG: phosphoribosylamine--glycine ligase [Candidatus Pelagibacter sp. TMED166]|tara:strand:- start:7068 stop:8339 length:1272 start_codon:yes stop_codon:yes gene_type:complete
MKKNILILGSGGREYAMAWKLSNDKNVNKIYCIPGNGGTEKIAHNYIVDTKNHNALLTFVKINNIDLTIVGPENLLDEGIVDSFNEQGYKIFGPTKLASKLESSKLYARDIMKKYNIPHPKYFACQNHKEVISAKEKLGLPLVLKADGLAAGKGVIICNTEDEFNAGLSSFFHEKSFGSASQKISVEECIVGPEISVFTVCNGLSYKIINNAQDHKRVFDDDIGPNTGGMGAYAPTPLMNSNLENKIKKSIIEQTLSAMVNEGCPFTGFLYFGLMIVNGDPYVIEYNVRMGDPETQVVLPMMDVSLIDLIESTLDKTLDTFIYKNKDGYCVTVVLASEGYPEYYKTNKIINGLSDTKGDLIFHAGTKLDDKKNFISSGGRVLNAVGYGVSLKDAIKDAYRIVNKINFENMFYRNDIGKKGLDY